MWSSVSLYHYIILGVIVFLIGVLGLIVRRSAIVLLMCTALILNGVHIVIFAFSRYYNNFDGQVLTIFSIILSIAAMGIGLMIASSIYKQREVKGKYISGSEFIILQDGFRFLKSQSIQSYIFYMFIGIISLTLFLII